MTTASRWTEEERGSARASQEKEKEKKEAEKKERWVVYAQIGMAAVSYQMVKSFLKSDTSASPCAGAAARMRASDEMSVLLSFFFGWMLGRRGCGSLHDERGVDENDRLLLYTRVPLCVSMRVFVLSRREA